MKNAVSPTVPRVSGNPMEAREAHPLNALFPTEARPSPRSARSRDEQLAKAYCPMSGTEASSILSRAEQLAKAL